MTLGLGATLMACDGEDDHVDLAVERPPPVEPSKLVGSVKDVLSRLLRQRFQPRTHREHLWPPSCFAASFGGAPLSIIREDLGSQRTQGSLTRP